MKVVASSVSSRLALTDLLLASQRQRGLDVSIDIKKLAISLV
jgi:hypothetical protein